MQRVLSMQTARGFGESTEFVTKRMCFSFLFTVGFLCLLCGFLIGRYAAQRVVDIRAEKEQKAVAGNGLESSEELRQRIIQGMETREFNGSAELTSSMGDTTLKNVKDIFSNLTLFSKIWVNGGCLTAQINGSHERDRYVVLTTGGHENINIVLKIVEELQKSLADNDWKPRRTLLFLLYENSMNDCLQLLSNHRKSKIVALLATEKAPIDGNGFFASSGSDVVQTTVLESLGKYAGSEIYANTYRPRLKINIPHSIITFVGSTNNTNFEYSHRQQQAVFNQRNLAKILTTSLWDLSQMNIFQWNPRIVEDTMKTVFSNLTTPDLRPYIQQIKKKLISISELGKTLNDQIGKIDGVKSLEVRMMNDLLKDLERALMCPDNNSQSRTDVTLIRKSQKSDEIRKILVDMLSCFDTAIQILQDMT